MNISLLRKLKRNTVSPLLRFNPADSLWRAVYPPISLERLVDMPKERISI